MKPRILSGLLAAAMAAGSVVAARAQAPRDFETAYRAAEARAGKAFESASDLGAAQVVRQLSAVPGADPARIEKLHRVLEAMEALRRPVAGTGAGSVNGLDAAYAAKVSRYANAFGVSPQGALDARRRLLAAGRGAPGATGAKAAGAPPAGTVPSAEAQRRIDAASARGATMNASRAQAMARALSAFRAGPGAMPDAAFVRGRGPVRSGAPANFRASDFAVGQHLKTGAVPAARPAAPKPKEEPSFWQRTKSALTTPWEGAKEKFDAFAARRMKESERLEQEGARKLERGGVANTVSAGWNSALAWGNRLVAADPKTVKQAAIGAGVVIAAVVAAPVVGAASVAAGVGAVVEGGVAGLTAYNVVKGSAALAREPNVTNAALLAVNFAPVPFLNKISHAAGSVASKGIVALKNVKTDSELLTASLSGILAVGERVGQREVEVLASSTVHDMTHVAGHHLAHAGVHAAAESIEEPPGGMPIPEAH